MQVEITHCTELGRFVELVDVLRPSFDGMLHLAKRFYAETEGTQFIHFDYPDLGQAFLFRRRMNGHWGVQMYPSV